MDQLACVDLPALPLQLLLRRHPDWAGCPSAVVAEDRPQAPILWINERAREDGVLPGLRYAQGLSLAAGLRAGVVSDAEIAAAVEEVGAILRRFSPSLEPAAEPGLFWLDASGLSRLHPSLLRWARSIVRELDTAGLCGAAVVGFTRFGTAALARLTRGARVLGSPEEERALACRVPLKLLVQARAGRAGRAARTARAGAERPGGTRRAGAERPGGTRHTGAKRPETLQPPRATPDPAWISPALCDALARLGVHDVEGLLRLPAGGLLERFGPEAEQLHRLAAADLWAPLQPVSEIVPVREVLELDDPETDRTRLLFLLKRRLDRLLWTLAERHEALTVLHLHLHLRLERAGVVPVPAPAHVEEQLIRPASPTLDGVQLLDLIRLRLEGRALPGAVLAVELQAEAAPAVEEQLQLFAQRPPRDLDAANRALARVRAEMGEGVVARAVLRDKHLPEARFAWEPLERLELAQRFSGRTSGRPAAGLVERALEDGPHACTRPRARARARAPAGPVELELERERERECELELELESGAGARARAPVRPLVRRLLREPEVLRGEDPGASHGPLYASRDLPPRPARQSRGGPYLLSGGWWRQEVCREYHFAESRSGALLWLYYDRQRRRWMLQGVVE